MTSPKQSAIRKAYGEHYEACKPDENGWSRVYSEYNKPLLPIGTYVETSINGKWNYRPIELAGIENNRGWTRIDGPDDLPKHNGKYVVLGRFGKVEEWLYSDCSSVRALWMKCFTHWRPVEEIPEPVY